MAGGDRNEAAAFLPTLYLGMRHVIPVASRYVAVVCPYAQTLVTLYDGAAAPSTQTCLGDDVFPGKAHFGSANGTLPLIRAGAYVESDLPVYVIYATATGDEARNVLGTRDQ